MSAVAEAVESVDCPVTLRVPLDVRDDVAVRAPPVIDPLVSVEKVAVIAFKSVAKKLDEVAFVSVVPPVTVSVLNVGVPVKL